MRRRTARTLSLSALLLASACLPGRARAEAPDDGAPIPAPAAAPDDGADIPAPAAAPDDATEIPASAAGPDDGAQIPAPSATSSTASPPLTRADRRHQHRTAPRVPGFRYEVGVRAFLGQANGVLAEAALSYRPERTRLALELGVEPVGWATDGEDPLGIFAGRVMLGFDSDLWAAGASVGALYARIEDQTRWAEGYGATFGVNARVGAVDGIHLSARADLVLVEGRASGGLVRLEGQVPTAGPWVRLAVSGGSTGSFYLDLGVRFQLTEARGDGAIFLMPTIGVGEVFDPVDVLEHYGVLVGLTVEHRP